MYETIRNLYLGGINPSETFRLLTPELQRENEAQYARYEHLCEQLSADIREAFEEFVEREIRIASIQETEVFIEGFRLGGQLALEITQNPAPPPRDNVRHDDA